jgi:hypothetical protein
MNAGRVLYIVYHTNSVILVRFEAVKMKMLLLSYDWAPTTLLHMWY